MTAAAIDFGSLPASQRARIIAEFIAQDERELGEDDVSDLDDEGDEAWGEFRDERMSNGNHSADH